MNDNELHKLLFEQQKLLSKIVLGTGSNNEILSEICLAIEDCYQGNSAKSSVLELFGEQLFHCASPSLPNFYSDAIDGILIGEKVGSCGTAAFHKKMVIVDDVETSELWADFQDLTNRANLKACWSIPLFSSQSSVLGTLAIYHDTPTSPSDTDIEILNYFSNLAAMALERVYNERKQDSLIEALSQSNQKFRAFVQVMPDLALIISEDGRYEDVHGSPDNPVYESAISIINQSVFDIFSPEEAKKVMTVIKKALVTNEIQVYEYSFGDGFEKVIFEGRITPVHYDQNSNERAKHILWMARDITAQKNTAKKITQLAYFDPLTKLPNRRMFNERLNFAVNGKALSNEYGAILFLDLDQFKRINDSLGHAAGDQLLLDVAKRLNKSIRKSDLLARIGGDEFVVLIERIGDSLEDAHTEISMVARKVQDAFLEKFEIENLAFQVSCSIGICLLDGSTSADNVLKFADTAMYNSKTKGGNNFSFYDPKKQTLLDRQLSFESEIVRAMENNEFCAYFQPQVDVNGFVTGAEALIRWVHPERGLIAPIEFIPVAEQFGLIQGLQNVVLEDICRLLVELNERRLLAEDFKLSINISHSQFKSANFKSLLIETIKKFDVLPQHLNLEITESMLSHDIDNTVKQMVDIESEGFSFSIDDFGTGYSSLSYLHAYPVNELKIDKSFVDRILDSSGLSIVETIANLARNLNMKVVAEGVENEQQVELLKKHQIDILQGYFFGRPMPFDDYVKWHLENVK